jgi:hypothetical protein
MKVLTAALPTLIPTTASLPTLIPTVTYKPTSFPTAAAFLMYVFLINK